MPIIDAEQIIQQILKDLNLEVNDLTSNISSIKWDNRIR